MPEEQATPQEKPESPHEQKRKLRALLEIASAIWRNAAASAETEDSLWSRYLPLLEACKDVLFFSPLHPDEARKLSSERRLNKALERLAGGLKKALFDADLGELEGWYVSDMVQERRRRIGLNRYMRVKAKIRKRRRR